MVKHNNALPNVHHHKWWQRHVKCWFNQPAKKQARRLARQDKQAKLGTRPIDLLRPAVHCPSQKYNIKVREGRGFTKEELKGAGLALAHARTIGIAVDERRKNRNEEGLKENVDRLKLYLSKLVVFPKTGKKAKKGLAGGIPADTLRSDVAGRRPIRRLSAEMPVRKPFRHPKSIAA